MPLITRQGKESKLTIQEMDSNLTYLEQLANESAWIYSPIAISNAQLNGSSSVKILDIPTGQYITSLEFLFQLTVGSTPFTVSGGGSTGIATTEGPNLVTTLDDLFFQSDPNSVAFSKKIWGVTANTFINWQPSNEELYLIGLNRLTNGTGEMLIHIYYKTQSF
jgi:hypothetical protein